MKGVVLLFQGVLVVGRADSLDLREKRGEMNKGRDNEAGGNGLSSCNVAKKQVRSLIGQGNEAAAKVLGGRSDGLLGYDEGVGNVTEARQIDSLADRDKSLWRARARAREVEKARGVGRFCCTKGDWDWVLAVWW